MYNASGRGEMPNRSTSLVVVLKMATTLFYILMSIHFANYFYDVDGVSYQGVLIFSGLLLIVYVLWFSIANRLKAIFMAFACTSILFLFLFYLELYLAFFLVAPAKIFLFLGLCYYLRKYLVAVENRSK